MAELKIDIVTLKTPEDPSFDGKYMKAEDVTQIIAFLANEIADILEQAAAVVETDDE